MILMYVLQAPKGAIKSKKSVFPKALVAGLLVLTGAVMAFMLSRHNFNTEVSFRDFHAQDVILDNKQSLVLEGVAGDPVRKALTEIPRGQHVIHYDVNAGTRYYAEFDIESGDNFIKPNYIQSRLPALNLRFELEDLQLDGSQQKIEKFTFVEYRDGEKITHNAEIQLNINSRHDSNDQKVSHSVEWKIILNGETISQDSVLKHHPDNESEIQRGESQTPLYADEFHNYNYRYYTSMKMMDFTLQSYFLHPSFRHQD